MLGFEAKADVVGGAALGGLAGAASAYGEDDERNLYKTMLRRGLIGAAVTALQHPNCGSIPYYGGYFGNGPYGGYMGW